LAGEVGEVNDDVHALGRTDADAVHLDRSRNQVAVGAYQEERIGCSRTLATNVAGEEELIETRWAGIQQAEAVPPGGDVQERLDYAVYDELVAQDAIKIEQIEDQVAAGIEYLVCESQWDIEMGEAGKAETGGLITGIKLVEQAVETDQSLVGVLGGEVYAVIVVPQRAQRLVDVAVGLVGGIESRQNVGVILVAELSRRIEVARITVTLGGVVGVVQMRGNCGVP
jgi:hypothetical protein